MVSDSTSEFVKEETLKLSPLKHQIRDFKTEEKLKTHEVVIGRKTTSSTKISFSQEKVASSSSPTATVPALSPTPSLTPCPSKTNVTRSSKRSIVRVKSCANPTLKPHLGLDNKIPTPPEPPTKTISFLPSVPPPPIYGRYSVLRPPPSKQLDLFITQSPPLLPLPPKTPYLQTSSKQPSPPPLKHHFHLALRPPSKPPDFVRATTVPP
ncbi:formin-like protein 3 [Vicia villosa]|uniref:formin-like protein 3 n=1 Tax=Vicia villosa TaxID=3911 RepID=UPI00273B2BFD|nr:formin-like protein 3 [Vicia villosa]